MTDEPTQDDAKEDFENPSLICAAAEVFVRVCRVTRMSPRETVACLSTALAITLRQSGTLFGPNQLEAIRLCIQLELDEPTVGPK